MPDFWNNNLKKSYEVSYALFRIAGALPKESFRRHLEEKALDLIIAGIEEDIDSEKKSLRVIDYLIRFGKETGIMHPETGDIVLKEVVDLDSAIAGFMNNSIAEPMDKESLFPDRHEEVQNQPSAEREIILLKEATRHPEAASGDLNDREPKILERIRQLSGLGEGKGCRLRDIQEVMGTVSERTLRYDLQNLVQKGLIERTGSGGPATFYKPREQA